MSKTAIGLAVLLFAVIAALLVAPSFVDLDRYRPIVAEKASAALGRPVTLGGPIKLSLLPSPHLTIRDLRIANLPGANTPDMARVREVDAALSFWPLLTLQVDVTSARVIQPVVQLERLADGRPNWSFAPDGSAPPGAAVGTESATPRPAATGTSSVRIARLTIEDGTVNYLAPSGTIAIEHINLVLTGDAVSGPLHAEGGLTTFGATLAATLDLGRFGGSDVPISLTLKAPPLASAEFTGAVTPGAAPRVEGKLGLKSGDLGDVWALAGGAALPPMLAKPLQVTADVTASGERIALEHLTLELGDIHGSGALHVTPGTPTAADFKFSVNTIDLDRFLAERAAVAATPAPKAAGGREAPITALPRDVGARAARLALPSGINASVDLGIDAVQWRQGVIRQLRLEAALANGSLAIKRLGALLPGGSDFAVSGAVADAGGTPRFDGSVEASADNFRDFLRWLGVAVEGVPADRLRRATLSSRLSLDGGTLEAKAIDLGFDSSRLTGAVTAALRERPAFGARIAIDQLNLDAYLGDGAAPTQAAATPAAAAAAVSGGAVTRVTVPQAVADALASFDANLDAGVATLIWRNQPIRKVHLVSTLENHDLTLTEFSIGDLGAASGKLSGYLQGIGGDEKADAVFDMKGPELGRVLRLVAPGIASADNFGAFTLGGELQQQGDRLSLESDLEATGGKLHLSASAPQAGDWTLGVKLQHPSFNRLMRLVSASYRPQGGELGAVSLSGTMDWTPDSATIKDLALDVGGMTAAGDVNLKLAARPLLTANLTLGDLVIDKFLPVRQTAFLEDAVPRRLMPGVMLAQAGGTRPTAGLQHWSKTPLDLDFLRLFDADVTLGGKSLVWATWRLADPQVKLALKDAVLTLPQLSGQLFGGALDASAALKLQPQPSLDIKAKLAGADLKEALTSNRLDGKFDTEADLATAGASPFELISALNGTALLKSGGGSINGINVPAINQRINQVKGLGDLGTLLRAATSGSTAYSSLDGTFKVTNGVAVSRDLHLVADGGEGNGTAIFDLPNWSMVSRTDLALTGVQGSPPIGITLKGPIDQPNWDVDFNAITRALGTRAIERLLQPQQPAPSQGSAATGSSGGGQSAAPQASQPVQPVQPQDILKNLLKH